MKLPARLLVSFVTALAVWLLFSWPLPKYTFTGIAASSENVEIGSVRKMIQGDHLQFMYYLWLGADMMSGHTRPLHNLYQFNTGNDDERFQLRPFYLPSSFTFWLLSAIGGKAFGYNATGFLSIWLIYLFTWLLARRYAQNELVAAAAAFVAVFLPYTWIPLLGGSPAGLAAMWVPALLLSLDITVRDQKLSGGFMAGLALLMTYCSDVQVFFFACLMVPFWGLLALLHTERFRWKSIADYMRLALVLLPLLGAVLLSMLMGYARKATVMSGSTMGRGRSWNEAALYSPSDWTAFFTWKPEPGALHHIYVGFLIPAIVLAGIVVLLCRFARHRSGRWRQTAGALLLLLGVLGVSALAMGAHGPFHGKLLLACRKFIPYYEMMRQTTKIVCLMPVLLAVLTAVTAGALVPSQSRAKLPVAACLAALAVLAGMDYRARIRPTVCVLENDHPSYRFVAEDAASRGDDPHVFIVPLWPGDSSWASLYQHYTSLYRIKMINGYSPVVKAKYRKEVFDRFQGANQGRLTEAEIDDVQAMGIDYLLFHENAFPRKVSPLTVGYTLKRLLQHPYLELIHQHEGVWAFRFTDTPAEKPDRAPGPPAPPTCRHSGG